MTVTLLELENDHGQWLDVDQTDNRLTLFVCSHELGSYDLSPEDIDKLIACLQAAKVPQ